MDSLFEDAPSVPQTPFLKQYFREKKKFPDAILFFRMGDFYETFFDDAKTVSDLTGIALTSKPAGKNTRVPLAGVPVKAVETYINSIIGKGYKVAVCEQLEPPGKKLIKREIVNLITPGTAVEPSLLNPEKDLYVCCVVTGKKTSGIAYAEALSGEFRAGEILTQNLEEELLRISPKEILLPEAAEFNSGEWFISRLDLTYFSPSILAKLKKNLGTKTLLGFGIKDESQAAIAAAALYEYLSRTTNSSLDHMKKIRKHDFSEYMNLDMTTLKNLEITESSSGEKKDSLLGTLDITQLACGRRLLKKWISEPLLEKDRIEERYDAVEELIKNKDAREDISSIVKDLHDPVRMSGRLGTGRATIYELMKFKNLLSSIPKIKKAMMPLQSKIFRRILEGLDEQKELHEELEKSLTDSVEDIIKRGYDPDLDRIKEDVREALSYISILEKRRREQTGISSIKIKYNAVIGYYYEVTKPNLDLVPADFRKKQWLSNAERFSDQELDKLEERIISGQQKIKNIEDRIIGRARDLCRQHSTLTRENGELISEIDVLVSFAKIAENNGYTRPSLSEKPILFIKESRHPVVENNISSGYFVPNDISLDVENGPSLAIITGPNMAGKSTYMRQAAQTVVMAQSGCFVPAQSAVVGLTDRIFSRIGASDDISKGISTFMAEMIETANITNNVTDKSLVILDEIGRGTSTFDGISIAWAVAEYLLENVKCRTLFATHYHELTALPDKFKSAENLNISVKRSGEKILFTRKVEKGSSSHSYGIEVARLAGLPPEVIEQAREILRTLEKHEVVIQDDKDKTPRNEIKRPVSDKIREYLWSINPEELTPKEALDRLFELKTFISEEDG
ncbi:DNA mismatch repair protein MutS [candidate division WOR-3 bacterium]|nr:DNA mismatch repair protein MutS [candidate division WOR-3 bacterium]